MKAQKCGTRILFTCALLMIACSSQQIRPVRDASDLSVEDVRLIAFSVVRSEQLPLRGLEMVVLGDSRGEEVITRVEFAADAEAPVLGLYRLPAGTVRFGKLRFYAQEAWWETSIPGPEITAAENGLTYLGRIQLQSVQIKRYADSARKYPAAAQITVSDFAEEDLPRIFHQFRLVNTAPVMKSIAGPWGDSGHVQLAFRPIPGRDRSYDEWITGPVGPGVQGTPKSRQ